MVGTFWLKFAMCGLTRFPPPLLKWLIPEAEKSWRPLKLLHFSLLTKILQDFLIIFWFFGWTFGSFLKFLKNSTSAISKFASAHLIWVWRSVSFSFRPFQLCLRFSQLLVGGSKNYKPNKNINIFKHFPLSMEEFILWFTN